MWKGKLHEVYIFWFVDIVASCQKLSSDALASIITDSAQSNPVSMVINCMGWHRKEVVTMSQSTGTPTKKQKKSPELVQIDSQGNTLGIIINNIKKKGDLLLTI